MFSLRFDFFGSRFEFSYPSYHEPIKIQQPNVVEDDYKPLPIASKPKDIIETKVVEIIEQETIVKCFFFDDIVQLYLNEKKLDNVEKTILNKESEYNKFSLFVSNKAFNLITKDDAIAYKNKLLEIDITAQTINRRMSFLKDLFEYGINHSYYDFDNPFDAISISRKSKLMEQVEHYESFSDLELKRIFNETIYPHYAISPDYFYLPFLALYTGARLEELASLSVHDVMQTDEGIYYFDIRKSKNKNSNRKIPLHSHILNSSFMDYFNIQKRRGYEKIFHFITPGKNGYGKNTSRRFGQYLDQIKIKSETKVFHSFRSNFINKMTEFNTHPVVLMGIVGHYNQAKIDLSSPHINNYQETKPIRILKDHIEKIRFEIDHSVFSYDKTINKFDFKNYLCFNEED